MPSSFICVHCVSGGGDGEEDVGSVRGMVLVGSGRLAICAEKR